MAAIKAELRLAALAERRRRSAADREAAAAALVDAVLPLPYGAIVAAYAALPTEPPTGPLLTEFATAGIEVLLPVLLPDNDLDWAVAEIKGTSDAGTGWAATGARRGSGALADCSLVVVPALLVDRSGTRLGRGGGSYDRALSRTDALTIAALYDGELVDRLPVEAHDVRVRAVVSPSTALYRIAPAP